MPTDGVPSTLSVTTLPANSGLPSSAGDPWPVLKTQPYGMFEWGGTFTVAGAGPPQADGPRPIADPTGRQSWPAYFPSPQILEPKSPTILRNNPAIITAALLILLMLIRLTRFIRHRPLG